MRGLDSVDTEECFVMVDTSSVNHGIKARKHPACLYCHITSIFKCMLEAKKRNIMGNLFHTVHIVGEIIYDVEN